MPRRRHNERDFADYEGSEESTLADRRAFALSKAEKEKNKGASSHVENAGVKRDFTAEEKAEEQRRM